MPGARKTFKILGLIAGLSLATAGCGAPEASAPAAPTVSSPASAPVSSPTAVSVMTPSAIVSIAQKSVLHAVLTPSGATDTVTVTVAGGSGRLTVTNPAGQTIWALPHVGGVGLMTFGHRHLPVLVTESDIAFCGSGGCVYYTYTYVPAARRFEQIPAPVSLSTAMPTFRFDAADARFITVPSAVPAADNFFGFATLSPHGLSIAIRLYDYYQHASVTTYAYAAGNTGPGSWQPAGPPRYTPDRAVTPPVSLRMVVETYLIADALGLSRESASLAASSAADRSMRHTLSPYIPYGSLLSFIDTGWNHDAAAGGGAGQLTVFLTHGAGMDLSLESVRIAARLTTVEGTSRVASLSVVPITLRYRTVAEVLRLLATTPAIRQYLAGHPQAEIDAVIPNTDHTWSVLMAAPSGATSRQFIVDAVTGQVTAG